MFRRLQLHCVWLRLTKQKERSATGIVVRLGVYKIRPELRLAGQGIRSRYLYFATSYLCWYFAAHHNQIDDRKDLLVSELLQQSCRNPSIRFFPSLQRCHFSDRQSEMSELWQSYIECNHGSPTYDLHFQRFSNACWGDDNAMLALKVVLKNYPKSSIRPNKWHAQRWWFLQGNFLLKSMCVSDCMLSSLL